MHRTRTNIRRIGFSSVNSTFWGPLRRWGAAGRTLGSNASEKAGDMGRGFSAALYNDNAGCNVSCNASGSADERLVIRKSCVLVV
jgi:hypothetical protein